MVPSLIGYNIADTTGFPSKYKFADVKNASMVVADTLEENVKNCMHSCTAQMRAMSRPRILLKPMTRSLSL